MRRNTLLVLSAMFALTHAGCSRKPAAPGGGAPAAAPKAEVVKVEKRTVKRVVEQPGSVQAFEEATLQAKLPGYVGALGEDPAKKGAAPHDRQIDIDSRVVEGQVLAEIRVPELDKEAKQKHALVTQAEAEVTQSKKAFEAAGETVNAATAMALEAEAGVARAQALFERWQSEANRISGLVKGGVIDAQTRDETLNQFKAAEATRAEANARVASARAAIRKAEADRDKAASDVDVMKARLDVAKAEAERVEAMRGYTKIRAPFDGVVTHRGIHTGDYVTGAEKGGLFALAKIDPVRVVVRVPEAEAGLVDRGQDVRIAFQGGERTGKVVRTSWALEPGSRTLRTEIDLPNERGELRPGTYVNARLTAELPAAWAVPAAAVGKFNDEPVVYLVEGGKAVRVAVQISRGDAQHTQVLRYKRPGADAWTDMRGDESVASPAAAVTDGQQVQ